jgi:NAD(P)-dependent dehydrogenase (short-subunit alcohol dehydrogenase family)
MSLLGSRLSGHTIVVLGAAGNLGPIWVRSILEQHGSVVACGLGVGEDGGLAALAAGFPGALSFRDCDITDSTPGAFDSVTEGMEPGSISGVVLNAGTDSVPGTGKLALTDYSVEEWRQLFDVNVFGVVNFLNAMVPHLANPSSVVTVGSMYGVVSPKPALYSHFNDGKGSMKNPAYGASKAALLAITKQYGTYLAPQGIRVNMLTLGGVAAGQDPTFVSHFTDHSPQGRMVPREELTGSLVYLLSDDSLSMTGHNMIVDGGYTAW